MDPKSTVYDNTPVDGPVSLREWIVKGYSHQFVEVTAEKLLIYGLGRGVDYPDMPLVRSIARDAEKNSNRFSALVLGVIKSRPDGRKRLLSLRSDDLNARFPGRFEPAELLLDMARRNQSFYADDRV